MYKYLISLISHIINTFYNSVIKNLTRPNLFWYIYFFKKNPYNLIFLIIFVSNKYKYIFNFLILHI